MRHYQSLKRLRKAGTVIPSAKRSYCPEKEALNPTRQAIKQ
jgi:hypothetical protein